VPQDYSNSLAGSSSGAGSGERPRAPRALPKTGETVGNFKIVAEIARGGMGVIYRVRRNDSTAEVEYALKLVNDAALDREGLARFQREMEALGRASGHPNVVRVSTSGVDPAGRPYYVMELLAGRTLHDRIQKEGPLPPPQVAKLGASLARALAHIHAQGIIHRDLKPANVLLREEDGTPVLTDFGLAALQGAEQMRLTRSNDIIGTPVFMAPEQAMGRSTDPRADVYGLGAILFTAASGETPVALGQQIEVLSRVAMGQITPLAKVAPRLPRGLAAIIERAMATQPEQRFPNATTMAAALDEFLGHTIPDDVEEDEETIAARRARNNAAREKSRLVPILGVVVVLGIAALAVLVPKALEGHHSGKSSGADPGDDLGAGQLLIRARGRLDQRPPDAKGALGDVERAIGMGPDAGPSANDLAVVRADALDLLGRGADARSCLEEVARRAKTALARSDLRARIGRLAVSELDLRAAHAIQLDCTCAEGLVFRLERALADGATADARAAYSELSSWADASPLEVAIAEASLARAEGSEVLTHVFELKKSQHLTQLDAGRVQLALAAAEPRDAQEHLQAAIEAVRGSAGRARVLGLEARLQLVALFRRIEDETNAGSTITAAETEAEGASPAWRARVAVERGRLAYARNDFEKVREATSAKDGAALREYRTLAAIEARDVTREGLSRWTSRLLGADQGLPGAAPTFADPAAYTAARRSARHNLGVVRGALAEAFAHTRRDLPALLDLEEAVASLRSSATFRRDSLRGVVKKAIELDEGTAAIAAAEKRTQPWLERALDDARLAVDLAPDDPGSLTTLLDGLVLAHPEPAPRETARRLEARLESLEPGTDDTVLLLARADLDLMGDPRSAAERAGSVTKAEPEKQEAWRVLGRADDKLANIVGLGTDLTHVMRIGAFEPAIARPLIDRLDGEVSEKALMNARPFALGGAVGYATFDALVPREAQRKRVRRWLEAQAREERSRPGEAEAVVQAAEDLASVAWREEDVRCQLLWVCGTAREKVIALPRNEAHALVELAEAVRCLNERALTFLVHVEAATQDPSLAKDLDDAIADQESQRRPTIWRAWVDVTLLKAAVMAARMKKDTSAPPPATVSQVVNLCDMVLDSDPTCAVARVVKSYVLSRGGQSDRAEETFAAALAIAPELEKPEEPSALAWIEKVRDGARNRTPARRR
jgi:hypothetical protein